MALVVSVPIPLRTQRARAPTRRKVFLLNYGKQKKITHHMGKAGLESIDPRRIEGPLKLMQPKSLQKAKRVASVLK